MESPVTDPLHLRVMSPSKTYLDVENVVYVNIRLADYGSIGIKPGHAPLIAETVTAPLVYRVGTEESSIDAQAGILMIEEGAVTVLTSGSGEYEISDPGAKRFDRLGSELINRLDVKPGIRSDTHG
jgi:F0F1-type ATP synthase epsilon subunit